jgi:hypothetical protein
VTRLEDRLRDAYRGAAGTVTADTIRDLAEPPAPRPRRRRLTPLAAAAAVTVIAVLAAVLPEAFGGNQHQPGPAAAPTAEPKFLIADTRGVSPLQVRNAATGALVATVTLPTEPGSQAPTGNPAGDGRTYIGSVATADGYHYLVSLYRLHHCRSWLYQFQLNDQGQPSAVSPFAALPTIGAQLYGLTVSGDGRTIAYTTTACMGSRPQPSYVAVTDIRTGQTKRWSTPAGNSVNGVSLTADGGLLYYSLQLGPSVVGAIPTSAAPGIAADRGRTVVQAAQFGPTDWVSFAAITPDGGTVYFTTYPEGTRGPGVGQVRALDLATGRSRVVYTPAGQPGLVTADPAVGHMLLQIQRHTPPLTLARLDLATGRVTYLPSAWIGMLGAVITW